MQTYLALLRGVNVSGHSLIKMPELQAALTYAGFTNVRTYIQSGNVIFQSDKSDIRKLNNILQKTIRDAFKLDVETVLFTHTEWRSIIAAAPAWWGKDPAWKHNILVMLDSSSTHEAITTIGPLKPDMELLTAGNRVLYQSADLNMIGRSATGSKMASKPIYKKMTIRNYNTGTKLLGLMDAE